MRVRANGCEFECEITGQGPDVVLVHGEIHGMQYWEYQLPELAKSYRVLSYNRRGHAGTELTEYGFSLHNQTCDLEALCDHFGMRQPMIIAVAFGTTIAANFAIRYPERVGKLVLVAWSELHDAMKYFERWAGYSQVVARILETEGREALVRHLMAEGGKTIYKVIPVVSPVREACVRMFASHPAEEYRRGMLEFATSVPDLVPALRKVTVPALGICGALDPYPDQPEVLAGMPDFREAPMIAGAGRFVHWEKPAEFNRAVLEFLSR